MSVTADSVDRLRTYQRLAGRNRIVSILRIGVPIIGAIVLVGLLGQIYLSSLGSRFGVDRIAVSRDRVTVDAPEYAGVLDDGTKYTVSAASAAAALNSTDIMNLTDAALTVTRTNGISTHLSAAMAQLDTTNELVTIPGMTDMTESTGTSSSFGNSVFDWASQTLTSQGPVVVDYADGSHLVAKGLVYDAKALVWTFSGATVTLPATPGAETP